MEGIYNISKGVLRYIHESFISNPTLTGFAAGMFAAGLANSLNEGDYKRGLTSGALAVASIIYSKKGVDRLRQGRDSRTLEKLTE